MEIDGDAEAPARRPAYGIDALEHRVDLLVAVHVLQLFRRVHFNRRKALRLLFLRRVRHVAGAVAADPAVNANLFAACAAHQLVNRRAEALALDVPQRLVDARDRAHEDAAAPVERAAIKRVPDILDLRRVAADEIIRHFAHAGAYGFRLAFQHGLAPAANSRVRFNFYHAPSGTRQKRLHRCDLHLSAS